MVVLFWRLLLHRYEWDCRVDMHVDSGFGGCCFSDRNIKELVIFLPPQIFFDVKLKVLKMVQRRFIQL